MKIILTIALGFCLVWGLACLNAAKAQSWVETVFVTNSDGTISICTITFVNGGRTRYMTCTP